VICQRSLRGLKRVACGHMWGVLPDNSTRSRASDWRYTKSASILKNCLIATHVGSNLQCVVARPFIGQAGVRRSPVKTHSGSCGRVRGDKESDVVAFLNSHLV
jgi:hypothetical protein